MSAIYTKEEDNVYVNVTFTNSNLDVNGSIMRYNETKSEAIIEKPSDFYCSIIRFDIPLLLNPLIIFPVLPGSGLTQISPWGIGVRRGGDYIVGCVYIPQDDTLSPVDQNDINKQIITPFYYVYDYNAIVYMLNVALQTSFLNAGSPGGVVPYLVYNYPGYLSFMISQSFIAAGASIVWNDALDPYLGYGFPSLFLGGLNQLNFIPRANFAYPAPVPIGTVPVTYKFDMEFNGCIGWSNIRKIVIVTNNIPIIGENIPVVNANGTQSGVSSYLPIISDFVLQVNNTSDPRSIAYYIPNPQYKLCDMLTDTPLYKVDFQIFFSDIMGNLYPVYLPPGQVGSVKLAFLRKSLYKNIF